MALATPKRSKKSSPVKQENIGHAISFLQDLPDKPREAVSLRVAVEQMQEAIRGALAKGYSYGDLAKMLSDKGIKISALTLKNYAPSGKRQGAKGKPRQAKKLAEASSETIAQPSSDELSTSPAATEAEAIAPPEETPTKPRRGRRKSVAASISADARIREQ